MNASAIPDRSINHAISELKALLEAGKERGDQEIEESALIKAQVLARYQPLFRPENLTDLIEGDFLSFLQLKNNKHWSGLHRHQRFIVADIDLLKEALAILVDEDRSIEDRLNQLISQSSGPMVPHLGRAVLTAILQIAYPNRYGVWNGTSEAALRILGIWPEFERGKPFGARYVTVNQLLLQLASRLQLDLWTLDYLWWHVKQPDDVEIDTPEEEPVRGIVEIEGEGANQSFGLERYLREFIIDNWNSINTLRDWELYEVDGETVGVEFNTLEIGQIDLLARHRSEPKWLVIELKRGQSSDQTIGQVLRYMGWVHGNLTGDNQQVKGLIICRSSDTRLKYALVHTSNIDLLLYEVSFNLRPAEN